jgi:D-glycero-D-manno-heptose 1,7-bisphosphate phosphatase
MVGGMKNHNRAVFLDRDGVINCAVMRNGEPCPPADLQEVVIAPDVADGLRRLKAAGFRLVVVTNQPDVARGTLAQAAVESIHRWLGSQLPLDEFRACFHDDGDECGCRKPRPGMIVDAARDAGIDLAGSFMVGDRWRDVEAAQRAGCTPVFIDFGYPGKQPSGAFVSVRSFREATDWILQHRGCGQYPTTNH